MDMVFIDINIQDRWMHALIDWIDRLDYIRLDGWMDA